MTPVTLLKYSVSSPADDTPLHKLKEAGYDASDIIGVVGKTEGK
jgi:cyanuric acid amidohydrolase